MHIYSGVHYKVNNPTENLLYISSESLSLCHCLHSAQVVLKILSKQLIISHIYIY